MAEPYKSRQFCKEVHCDVQRVLDDPNSTEYEKQNMKKICKNECRKTAYEFHDYLQKNNFTIADFGKSFVQESIEKEKKKEEV